MQHLEEEGIVRLGEMEVQEAVALKAFGVRHTVAVSHSVIALFLTP